MNFDDAHSIQLIDFSAEDDLLIDSHFDATSFDLRLSVSVETQKELQSDQKSGVRAGTKDRVPSLAKVERKNFRLERWKGDSSNKECIARKSLAWDQSFFTSAGFLELDELCLVNQGFKNNLKVSSSQEIEAGKGKVRHGKNLSDIPSIGAGSKQKIQPSMKTKLMSPSKMVPMQSSKRQQMTTARSQTFPGVIAKSHLVQNTSSRKESLKSTRIMGQISASTDYTKKPPLRATSKSGLATSIPGGILQSASVLKSLETQAYSSTSTASQSCGMKVAEPQDSEALNFKGHRNKQQHHSSIKQSPLSAKTSSLRQPSQKIGYFEMRPETLRQDQDGIKHSNKGKLRSSQPCFKKQTHSLESEEKENLFHPEDTVIELRMKMDKSPSPSKAVASGSSISKGHSSPSSSSSKKVVSKIQRSVQKNLLSPLRAPKTPFLSKLSPWKKKCQLLKYVIN